jgi:hypothetical protein
MSSEIPTISIKLPSYRVDSSEPDHNAIGKIVDDSLRQYFEGQTLIVRGISSAEHPGKSAEDIINIIKKTGTDRYNPEKMGDRYENIQKKQIDLFAFRRKITRRTRLFKDLSWGFYHGSLAIHGRPTRLDILIVYDSNQLQAVLHQYEGRKDTKRDGFVFKNPSDKPSAVKAIFHLLS